MNAGPQPCSHGCCGAGKHADAINEYTKAIALNPTSHVYYSNRAIACIKLFRFEQVG